MGDRRRSNTAARLRDWSPFTGSSCGTTGLTAPLERDLLTMARAFELAGVVGPLAEGRLQAKPQGADGRRTKVGRNYTQVGSDENRREVPSAIFSHDMGVGYPASGHFGLRHSRLALIR